MIKLVLAIRSLDLGGAERQFIELVKHLDKTKFEIMVCTMYGGIQEDDIKQIAHIRYINLEKTGRYDFYNFYKKYKRLLEKIKPDVVYSFLGEMNLYSLWCKPRQTKIIWGFRATNMEFEQYGSVSQLIFWLQKKLSSKVDGIILNSIAAIEFHKQHNFDMEKSVVIHNGIDVNRFQKNDQKRELFRAKYNLKNDDIAVGIVARIDYMKGYLVFSRVAKKILDMHENIFFFSIGSGDEKIKKECQDILGPYNESRFFWLGSQKNVEDIYSGLDISSSSSFGEGFSNSIAEAMSCELPCVVTDVGDSKVIIADTGILVKPNDIDSFYNGLTDLIQRDYKAMGKLCRKKIIENFSIEKMVEKTQNEIIKCVE